MNSRRNFENLQLLSIKGPAINQSVRVQAPQIPGASRPSQTTEHFDVVVVAAALSLAINLSWRLGSSRYIRLPLFSARRINKVRRKTCQRYEPSSTLFTIARPRSRRFSRAGENSRRARGRKRCPRRGTFENTVDARAANYKEIRLSLSRAHTDLHGRVSSTANGLHVNTIHLSIGEFTHERRERDGFYQACICLSLSRPNCVITGKCLCRVEVSKVSMKGDEWKRFHFE